MQHYWPSATRAHLGREVAARLDADPLATRVPDCPNAELFLAVDYLSAVDCEALIRLIDQHRRPSTMIASTGDPDFRTSESCDLDRWPAQVDPIDRRFADLLGLPPDHGEPLQGQRYAPGQQFRAHCDYFHEDQPYWPAMQAQGGHRIWTVMAYLNPVEQGGATWFPRLGLRVVPRTGLVLAWNNLTPEGSPNYDTLHEGMRVIAGTKYVVTKWFRERPFAHRLST